MINFLPAVLIGGPPNAGKSVLFYSLTKTLHERGVPHHAIRACPDGEGNWYQQIQQQLDPETIRLIRVKGPWTLAFVDGIRRDLERRHFPLLVDMGGKPQDWQMRILLGCSHSILLLRPDEPESAERWRTLTNKTGLLSLAEIDSVRGVPSVLAAEMPVIRGTLADLERGFQAHGPVFESLVARITELFTSYSLEELEQAKLAMAPGSYTINVATLLRTFDSQATEWQPAMLPRLLESLSPHTSLNVYGRGPNWLYSTLAAFAGEFYQFDPRIGWLAPPPLKLSKDLAPAEIETQLHEHRDGGHDTLQLSVSLKNQYLDHLQAEHLPFPPVAPGSGLILDGRMPLWLFTALTQLYRAAGAAWIACHQPTLGGAVVVMSRVPEHTVGELVPLLVKQ